MKFLKRIFGETGTPTDNNTYTKNKSENEVPIPDMSLKNPKKNIVKRELTKGEPFYIAGQKYLSQEDIYTNSQEIDGDFGYSCKIHHHKNGAFIVTHDERYPCFDSCDYQYENRYYYALYFCDSLDEALKKNVFLKENKYSPNFIDQHPKFWDYSCPFVYLDDGEDTFRVYEIQTSFTVREMNQRQVALTLQASGDTIGIDVTGAGTTTIDWGDGSACETLILFGSNHFCHRYQRT